MWRFNWFRLRFFLTIPEGTTFYNGGFLIGSFLGMSLIDLIAAFLYVFLKKK